MADNTGSGEGRYPQALLVHVLEVTKRNAANTLDTIMTVSAVLETLFQAHPELSDAYQRNLANAYATSPAAETKRQVLAELDQIVAELKGWKV